MVTRVLIRRNVIAGCGCACVRACVREFVCVHFVPVRVSDAALAQFVALSLQCEVGKYS